MKKRIILLIIGLLLIGGTGIVVYSYNQHQEKLRKIAEEEQHQLDELTKICHKLISNEKSASEEENITSSEKYVELENQLVVAIEEKNYDKLVVAKNNFVEEVVKLKEEKRIRLEEERKRKEEEERKKREEEERKRKEEEERKRKEEEQRLAAERERRKQAESTDHYDFKNLGLLQLLEQYLSNVGISSSSVSLTYISMDNPGNRLHFNGNVARHAASTYKFPLAMLITDGVREGKFSYDEQYKAVRGPYDSDYEYKKFLREYGESVTIDQLFESAIFHSQNVSASTMSAMLGGRSTAMAQTARYAEGVGGSISESNYTTTAYMAQMGYYLYNHRNEYPKVYNYMTNGFRNAHYSIYLNDVAVTHKVGFLGSIVNDVAIVHHSTPYIVALYTRGLTRDQFGKIAKMIDHWHRVHH